jgi:hypothetical protein
MFSKLIFDGTSSELYDVMCVKIGGTSGETTASAGCETESSLENAKRNNKFYIIDQSYSVPMSFTFQLINTDGSRITTEKERTLKRWLCHRGVFKWFQIDNEGYENIWYKVNISNPKLIDISGVVGMEFTATTDSSFGYSPILTKKFAITTDNKTVGFFITNDEDDYIYPIVTITMNETGNLQMTNSTEVENRNLTINNVTDGEVITIDSGLPDISSSISHDVYQDFNKHWLRFVDGKNSLTFNLNCTGTIQYREPRKVGLY